MFRYRVAHLLCLRSLELLISPPGWAPQVPSRRSSGSSRRGFGLDSSTMVLIEVGCSEPSQDLSPTLGAVLCVYPDLGDSKRFFQPVFDDSPYGTSILPEERGRILGPRGERCGDRGPDGTVSPFPSPKSNGFPWRWVDQWRCFPGCSEIGLVIAACFGFQTAQTLG